MPAGILPKIHRGNIVIRFLKEQREANETSKSIVWGNLWEMNQEKNFRARLGKFLQAIIKIIEFVLNAVG